MLTELVPSLNLCRQIPDGAFSNSALVWVFDPCAADKSRPEYDEDAQFFFVAERSNSEIIPWDLWGENPPVYPAPLLEELVRELPLHYAGGFLSLRPGVLGFQTGRKWTLLLEEADRPANLAESALQLWFHLKGKESEDAQRS